ncbi:MAG: hypothetical protein LBH98_10500 [Chitinispirillales bacterium]|jgi:hypothetical protein|nr:hypothetical protein [Chitinispirillales bacterium]
MRQITLNNIPNRQVPLLTALFKNLSFISPDSISVHDEKAIFLDELEESVQQVKAHMKGEIKLKSAWDLLDEL